MQVKGKLVAVFYDNDDKCERVAQVKNVTDREYNKLLNEQTQKEIALAKEKEHAKEFETKTNEHLAHFKATDLLLAKSIYDNFVDRGLVTDDANFQQAFYNYIFLNAELDVLSAPYDFKVILRKVGSL